MAVRYVEVAEDAGQRLDNFLMRELKGLPRSRVYRLLRKGEARVNGRRARPDYRLQAGDRVRLPPYVPADPGVPRPSPSKGLIDWLERSIIHQDDEIVVINKPSGVAVHGGSGISHGVVEALRARLGAGERLELAHRLDRDTSGCLVLARRRSALLELHAAFREGRVAKRYDALVHGAWPKRVHTVQLKLVHYVTRGGERRVRTETGGKAARTDFTVHETGASATWLEAHPHTGRTHQIRVHAAQSGHAIVGDRKYAAEPELALARLLGIQRLCLHARSVTLPTASGGRRRFVAPPPDDFLEAWQKLRRG